MWSAWALDWGENCFMALRVGRADAIEGECVFIVVGSFSAGDYFLM